MKIYLVVDPEGVFGRSVFTTREKAEKFNNQWSDRYNEREIIEVEVDDPSAFWKKGSI